MNSVVELLVNNATNIPDVLFCADNGGNEYTYAEAWKKTKVVANWLKTKCNLKKGDRLMVECNQEASYLILNFACELIGVIFVPIESNASTDRKQSIYEDTESVLYVYASEPVVFVKSISFSELFEDGDEISEYSLPDSGDIAEILFTTGTTGKSKGIVLSNRANVALAENIKYGVSMKPGNVDLIPVPISHAYGVRCSYANILNGGTIILIDGIMRAKNVFQLMDKYGVTSIELSPSAASLLIKLSKGVFWDYGKKLDYIQLGTASLSEDLKEQLIQELGGVRLYNIYGSTESGRSCAIDFSSERRSANCIGKPTKNAEISFTDEERNFIEATKDNPGLLASRGAMNMECYWKNPELTNQVLRDNYLFTNDLGYKDEDGYIYVLGRKDDVINYNGIKIAPDEIEEVANRYPEVNESACVPSKDPIYGQIPKLFVSLAEGVETLNVKGLMDYLREHLDGNKIPKQVEVIEQIPRTFNGKLKRRDLIK